MVNKKIANDARKHIKHLNVSIKLSCPMCEYENILEVRNFLASLMMLRTTRHPNKMYAIKHDKYNYRITETFVLKSENESTNGKANLLNSCAARLT